jgi:hypothetical protein
VSDGNSTAALPRVIRSAAATRKASKRADVRPAVLSYVHRCSIDPEQRERSRRRGHGTQPRARQTRGTTWLMRTRSATSAHLVLPPVGDPKSARSRFHGKAVVYTQAGRAPPRRLYEEGLGVNRRRRCRLGPARTLLVASGAHLSIASSVGGSGVMGGRLRGRNSKRAVRRPDDEWRLPERERRAGCW